MTPRGLAAIPFLAFVMTACINEKVEAQYFGQYGSPQAYQPSQPAPSASGGCYSGGGGPWGSCYSITPPTGHWSCYSGSQQPGYQPFTQNPPQPYYDVLCHDTVTSTHKVTLHRYYPVYIHLREKNHYEGVQIEERWSPVCVLCTTDKPCPRHQGGQTPGDIPPPADPRAQAPDVPAPTPSSMTEQVNPVIQQAAAASNSTAPVAPSPAPVTAATAPATSSPAPAKQWVWLTYEGVYGYGYQRADGYWEIDPGSRRPVGGLTYQVASTPGG